MSSTLSNPSTPLAARANRAIGAMFFSCFGTAWLCWGDMILYDGSNWTLAPVLVLGLILVVAAARKFSANRAAFAEKTRSPQARRVARIFHAVNAAQWVLIVLLGSVLHGIGLDDWIVPTIIAIVGLHFLPLAALMQYRPHYLTGLALMLLAVLFPLVAQAGPRSGVGPLGAGLILWASAGLALAV